MLRRIWRWLWPSDAPTFLGFRLSEIRAVAGAFCLFCLGGGANASSSSTPGHRHEMLTYFLWYGAAAALAVVVIVTSRIMRRRNGVEPPASAPTATFRGGALSGDAELEVRSSADHLTHGTSIGDRVRLRAEHHPGRDLDSDDESAQEAKASEAE
jgi:hypothetical protein